MGSCLGKNIKELRKELGITQLQLATMIGVSKRTIEDYEQGVSKEPSANVVFSLAGFFKVDPVKLLYGGITMTNKNLYEEAIIEELKQISSNEIIQEIHDMDYNGVVISKLGLSNELIEKVRDNWKHLYIPNPNSKVKRNWYRTYIVVTIEKYIQNRSEFLEKYNLKSGMEILENRLEIMY